MFPPIEEQVTPEMLAAMPEDQRASWQDMIDQSIERKRLIAEKANAGDWNGTLILCDSQERAPVLIRAGQMLEGDELRELVAHWWSTTEAWSGDPELRDGMFDLVRRAAPVIVPSDDAGRLQTPPEGSFRVYRGNLGEEPHGGSWTLDRDVAERFAAAGKSLRAQLVFGIDRPDGVPSVWEGVVTDDDVLGFFDDRHEYEIVTDRVRDVKLIAQAVTS